MQAVKQALRTKAIATASLVTALGGQHFYHRAPDKPIDTMLTDGATAICTYNLVSGVPDEDVPRSEELYDIHVWSRSADKNDAVGEIVISTFDRQALTMTGRRLGRIVHVGPVQEFYEADIRVHHKVIPFRIITYPSA
jgi:hypothetical protein